MRERVVGASTRARLLDSAEALFAERGVRGASLRDITAAAGANLAAVHYHFGSKEDLLREIVMRRARVLFSERMRLLELAESVSGENPPTVKALVSAFVEPMFRLGKEYPHFPALLARVQMENLFDLIGDAFRDYFYQTLHRFTASLARALPDLAVEEIRWRLLFTVGSFHFVTLCRPAIAGVQQEFEPEDLIAKVVAFSEAGLHAPGTMPSAPHDPREASP